VPVLTVVFLADPPKAYVLRSSVPPELLRHAATATVKGLGPVGETSASGARAETMLRDFNEWQAEKPATLMDHRQDETGTYGLLGVVLALILVNGKVLTDGEQPGPVRLESGRATKLG